jgi:hypothetical protein
MQDIAGKPLDSRPHTASDGCRYLLLRCVVGNAACGHACWLVALCSFGCWCMSQVDIFCTLNSCDLVRSKVVHVHSRP